ncbi:MAG TPA: flagellar hook-associated protein FlgK [Pseudolabrys sp.]|nr:flagellar hook-associated protein FlgK [Pseudolabrys sp.]
MSLTQSLATALSGLQVSQASIGLVSSNVANADTPGYVRKTVQQVQTVGNGTDIGVRIADVQRTLDQYIQRQLRAESSGASYADTRAQMYSQLQDVYGQPGAANALETVYNSLTTALQALSTSPDDPAARSSVIGAAQTLAQQLNQASSQIQGLRSDAELGISNAVEQANNALSQIAALNQQILGRSQGDSETATLMDQRDAYIDQLSQLMDISVIKNSDNQVSVFTNSGIQLVGTQASVLSFNAQGTVTPASQWSANSAQSTLGTVTLTTPAGNSVDMLANGSIRSGSIAAYVQMRDQDLVQAQNQLDAMASAMASALSDTTTAGTAVAVGPQNGFDIDIGGLSAGNTVTVNYTDTATSTQHTLTLIRVDDPSVLPLPNSASLDPNDTVAGIDFSAGLASVITQINAAFAGTGMTASNPSGTTLEVLDDGAANTVDVNAVSATQTATSLTSGSAALPFFTDGGAPYTGAITAAGSERVGLAARIAVNPALVADPSGLVVYQSGTAAGDSTRPDFILQQLTNASLQFAPNSGIGTAAAPFSGLMTTFLRQVISQQGLAANAASNLKQGQDVVLATLQQRFNDSSGVNIDQEMGNLLVLQNSYAANARVLSTVKEMLDTLLQL